MQLFWSFVKVGFTSFGGLSMVPLINSEMLSHGWMDASEVADIVAIAEMTPGPLGLNCATFAGVRAAGVLGALSASLGVMLPIFTLCLAAAVFFEKFKNAKIMQSIMTGVRPACFALVVGICLEFALTNYTTNGNVNISAVVIAILDIFLLMKLKITIPKVIILNAALGMIFYGVVPMYVLH